MNGTLRDALEVIDRHGCTTYWRGRCLDPGSGRERDAQYGADRWCDACIARDALDRTPGLLTRLRTWLFGPPTDGYLWERKLP